MEDQEQIDESTLSPRMKAILHNQRTRHVAQNEDGCRECQAIRYEAYRGRHPLDKWVAKHLGV